MKVLVTGGLGFIGSHIANDLASEHEVMVCDAYTYAASEARLVGIEIVRADVASPLFAAIVKRFHPDRVVHLAAESHVTRSEVEVSLNWHTNVAGTVNALCASLESGVERFVHFATDEVYGDTPRGFRVEHEKPPASMLPNAYARSKSVAEDAVLSFEGMDVVSLRPSNCFGPWQHPEKAMARWITHAIRGEDVPVWGDGSQVRQWVAVEDVVSAARLALDVLPPGRAYNVGGVPDHPVGRVAEWVAGRFGVQVNVTGYHRPNEDRRYGIDSALLRSFGWEPRVGQAQLVPRIFQVIEWYAANGAWWLPFSSDAESLYEKVGA